MKKNTLFFAAILGATGILLGALGAHALKKVLSPDQLTSYETAVRYQLYHALFLVAVGVLVEIRPHKLLTRAAQLGFAGTLCFSGSIYVLVFTQIGGIFGLVTPLGGVLLVAAWSFLAIWAFQYKKNTAL